MNSIYETMNRLSGEDLTTSVRRFKQLYNFDDQKIAEILSNITGFLTENKPTRDKVFIGMLDEPEFYAEIEKAYNMHKASFLHSRKTEALQMVKYGILFEGLEDLYRGIAPVLKITEEEFVLTWTIAIASGCFTDLLKMHKGKPANESGGDRNGKTDLS